MNINFNQNNINPIETKTNSYSNDLRSNDSSSSSLLTFPKRSKTMEIQNEYKTNYLPIHSLMYKITEGRKDINPESQIKIRSIPLAVQTYSLIPFMNIQGTCSEITNEGRKCLRSTNFKYKNVDAPWKEENLGVINCRDYCLSDKICPVWIENLITNLPEKIYYQSTWQTNRVVEDNISQITILIGDSSNIDKYNHPENNLFQVDYDNSKWDVWLKDLYDKNTDENHGWIMDVHPQKVIQTICTIISKYQSTIQIEIEMLIRTSSQNVYNEISSNLFKEHYYKYLRAPPFQPETKAQIFFDFERDGDKNKLNKIENMWFRKDAIWSVENGRNPLFKSKWVIS
jgi:hypothetical protein